MVNKNTLRNRREMRKKRKRRIRIGFLLFLLVIIVVAGNIYIRKGNAKQKEQDRIEIEQKQEMENDQLAVAEGKKKKITEVLISAAGDCTLGTDTKFAFAGSFTEQIKKNNNDYALIMRNVADIFNNDDYTIVNLETALTNTEIKANKGQGTVYHFKGPGEYANILKEGNIDGVTISNNHIYDYDKEGFNDTINNLKEFDIDYCGEGNKIIRNINGVKFGFLGYNGWSASQQKKSKIKDDIDNLKSEGVQIVIPYFHWGIEKEFKPNSDQIELGRFAIDSGADMVLGSHSHVMQTLENYKGKLIAYSLGNFSFGGNSNPSDKRTFILQAKFIFEEEDLKGIEYKVIPTLISSVTNRNDYSPTLAIGEKKQEIIDKLNDISPSMKGIIRDDFFNIE